MKGIIINGGPNNVVDGVSIDVLPEIYEAGFPVMAAGHDKALCEVKLPQFTDDVEAIKDAVKSFVFDTCKAEANWNMTNFVNDQIELIRRQVGDRKVLLALSGGVDSSVVAALLLKAIGDKLVCVHVNHGLMRKGESEAVVEIFGKELKANLIYVDATDRFLSKLENVADPEQKRKIIGGEFIRVFEEEARKLDGIDFLGQGTIYPDIVESGTKTAKMVKSHHNVGGLPEDLQFELVEPLRQLFKDEVRACGVELGLPYEMVYRQPFPGPGLGVRCLGAITRDRLEAVRESDAILREEFQLAGLDKKVWQYFTVVPDFKSVGVRDKCALFRLARHYPCRQYGGCYDRYRRAGRLAHPDEDYRPYPQGSEDRQPCLLRYVSETQCDNRVGVRLANDNDSLTLKMVGLFFYDKNNKE